MADWLVIAVVAGSVVLAVLAYLSFKSGNTRDGFSAALGALSGLVAAYLLRKQDKPAGAPEPPPDRVDPEPIASAGIDAVHGELSDDLDRIEAAASSDTPASDVATLVNSRRRRDD
jgi:hypothetical protein